MSQILRDHFAAAMREEGVYRPTASTTNPENPPTGGSGVPPLPASLRRLGFLGAGGGIGRTLVPLLDGFSVYPPTSAVLDVRDPDACRDWAKVVDPEILIFGAVANHDSVIHRASEGWVHHQVAVTCEGLANILRAVLPGMRKAEYGRVIFLSSVVSRLPTPGAGIYGACKAFGEALIRTAAVENAAKGVTCNSVRMGYFATGLRERMPEEAQQRVAASIPARRWGSCVELARVVRMIVETPYVNGATIDVAGGL